MRRFFVLAIILSSLSVAAGCQRGERPGDVGSSQGAIVDGTTSAEGAYPDTVLLWLGGGLCTGTLISERVVLTARHCLQGVSSVDVFFGNDPEGSGGTWIEAVDWQVHNSTDIGALTLRAPGPANPIPIYRDDLSMSDVGRSVTIVGFGDTAGAGPAGIKREGTTRISQLQSDVVFVGEQGSKTCYGDSGGPTFIDEGGVRHIAGVTSFGTSQDCTAGLSGQIRTDLYVDWIESYLGQFGEPSCEQDNLCAEGCSAPDPDCPCAADGFCTDQCQGFATADPDCEGCAADDQCRTDCPQADVDCCGMADDTCIPGCDGGDPDCGDLGETCEADDECNSVLCGTVGEESRCTDACSDDGDCPKGFTCMDETACWPKSDGACSAAGGGSGVAGALILIALVSIGRRRRASPGRRSRTRNPTKRGSRLSRLLGS